MRATGDNMSSTRRRRILFIDDEPNVLASLRLATRPHQERCDFEFADSGADALERLRLRPFDVVISDLHMPYMDGYELLAEVKERFPSVVRLLLTGQADRD